MKEISKKIIVDLSRRGKIRNTYAVQNDKGSRKLNIGLIDEGAPYHAEKGTVAVLNYRRPDDVDGALTATIEDDTVSVYLNPAVIGEVGITVCSVSLFDSKGNKLTSSEFCIDVSEELYSGEALDESPEYTLLEGVFSKLSEFTLDESERAEAEKERDQAEKKREAAEIKRDKKVNDNLGVGGTVVLSAEAWSSIKTQSFNIAGLKETDLVIFYPSSDSDRAVLANYGVFISPDTVGETVTAIAKAIPISDISVRYFIIRGRVPEEV